MKFFLKSKHWQLFIVVVGIPLVLEIGAAAIMLFKMISGVLAGNQPDPMVMFGFMSTVWPVIMGVCLLIYFLWFYTLGISLHKKLPSSVKMNLNLFLIFITYPLVYMVAFCFIIPRTMQISNGLPPFSIPMSILYIIPFHLFAMFCMFYCLYFVAKALKSAELQREALLGDYIIDFILFWFYFVGIWFFQPRINKLFAEDESHLVNEVV